MLIESFSANTRPLRSENLSTDFAVIGGGLSGICNAIAAARAGIRVVLVQDRPVLGGNASSEIRLWVLGATSHMGNNNRWAREGALLDEILVENLYRNREGNPVIFDTLLLEKVLSEPNITLLLNTAAYACEKSDPRTIKSVSAFNAQNATHYTITAPLFCDATGDGIIAFNAGASFSMGSEPRSAFNELIAPEKTSNEMLGHSLYFYTRDTGKPVTFTAPNFALNDITKIPRYRDIKAGEHGCKFWWFEYGGTTDTVHDTELIKYELWKVAYGAWNHIKNSGLFPEAATHTLEWVGSIPGKRESRRFNGDSTLTQQDIVEQRQHPDDVSYGGWAIDLHPADGVYSPKPGCSQWHAKGIFPIPYSTLYSKDISNLFLAGRNISASHIAFGSTRVMCTCANNGSVTGNAAALCIQQKLLPRDLSTGKKFQQLRTQLLLTHHHIPHHSIPTTNNLAALATITGSSTLQLQTLPPDGPQIPLDFSWAQMLPLTPESGAPKMTLQVTAQKPTTLSAELRISDKPQNHTPNLTLATQTIQIPAGTSTITLDFSSAKIPARTYAFYTLLANPHLTITGSSTRLTGILTVCQKYNPAVAKSSMQTPPPNSGIDTFEYWCPQRRPLGHNFAFTLDHPLDCYSLSNLLNGLTRPTTQPNAWTASPADKNPTLTLTWPTPQKITAITLSFDTDYDHPMESVQWGHPESKSPFCIPSYQITANNSTITVPENHQSHRTHHFESPITTSQITLQFTPTPTGTPTPLFHLQIT